MTIFNIAYQGQSRTKCVHRDTGDEILTGEQVSPTDLLAIALGSCVLTLMGLAAGKLDLAGLRLVVEKEMTSAPVRRIGKLKLDIYCPQLFEPGVTERLEKAGRQCPVHQSLHPDIVQEFTFHWGQK